MLYIIKVILLFELTTPNKPHLQKNSLWNWFTDLILKVALKIRASHLDTAALMTAYLSVEHPIFKSNEITESCS